ncbi:hypothetical protein [Sulfobacillus harzensis]|uniref:Uncharacterized protein n=1 Tax=Sulfobacillus harzensis TaxID=2729629 RepID=A0A7Y0Q1K6_9FIRM|nr:hypothetical protein [Sulfobacillus harzensis]NMP22188.1 hypothetical protein [Sulfobacillus harzensis]
MILLHPYAWATRQSADQAPTWAALRRLSPVWLDRDHRIIHAPVGDDTRYEEAVKHWWGRDSLIICEQDIAPPPMAIWHLEHCPHPLCAWAYPLWHRRDAVDWPALAELWGATKKSPHSLIDKLGREIRENAALHGTAPKAPGPPYWTWPHRVIEDPADPIGTQRWVETGERWADLAALGLTKIEVGVQRMVNPDWAAGPWHNLDSRIAWYLWDHGYGPWHLHWPAIPHNHQNP